ncbi:MAG: DUF4442 domain-containing protein [Pseudomonadota bacterium]|nr:DUF4442 domain-containing protein [Pseudomonadota bacterium]
MNRLNKVMNTLARLPAGWQPAVRSLIIGKIIPFAGTAGCRVEVLTNHECRVVLKNRRKVGNHIGTVHAAAMALVAESATGFVAAMNVPDSRVLVIRSMELTYLKRTKGDLTATATLSDDDLKRLTTEEKGDIAVPVVLRDSEGTESVTATMIWAWTPKRK